MAANHLKKITARAKQIRKAHPKMIWTDAVKKASKELAGKKIGAVKKKAAPKKAAKKTAVKKHVDTKSHNVNIRVVSGSTDKIKQLVEYQRLLEREQKAIDSIAYWKEQIKKPSNEANAKHAKFFYEHIKKQLDTIRKQKALQKQLI